jgi:NTP pyrophosphatase (non-canonical NTP hydrolase)
MIVWNAVGIAGEAGEVVDNIKKGIFHQHGLDENKVKEELGDLLWYVAGLCTQLGLDLDEVMVANIEKLQKRYPGGFSVEDSKNRHTEWRMGRI